MGIINILDTQTANMIAAGEVVEKPASAVKEMIENSIDAGATHITCEIRGGGNSYIRISDNGKGISCEDLPKTILPHATSKIKTAEDLDGVMTLGFRGEALAAISSVSRLEILSKQRETSIGNKLTSDENGVEITEEGSPDGTVITVKDLFYNVPARRKFMRKDSSEASAIASVIIKAALSHPEISFKLVTEGATKFITPGDGDLYSSIYASLGKEFASAMTAVAGFHEDISVGGYISKPGESRGSRSGQYFFVNGRPVQSTQIMAALEQGFRSYMPQKRFPAAVLKLSVPPKSVDVNVHPAKTEIKFADDRKIFEAVYSAVVSALRNEESAVEFVNSQKSYDNESTESSNVAISEEKPKIVPPSKPTPLGYSIYRDRQPQNSYIFLRDPNVANTESYESRVKKATRNSDSDASTPINDEVRRQAEEIAKGTKLSIVYLGKEETPKNTNEITSEPIKNVEHQKTIPSSSESINSLPRSAESINSQPLSAETTNSQSLSSETTNSQPLSAESINSQPLSAETTNSQSLSSETNPPQQLSVDGFVQLEQSVDSSTPFRVIGEAFGGYIIAEIENKLLIIDKHAAHERILYEDLVSKRSTAESQQLLSPHVIRLGNEETDMLLENKDILLTYGFEIDSFGNDSIAIRAIPSTLTAVSGIEQLLDGFAATLSMGDRLAFDKRCDRALYTLACKAAIKLGPPSKNEELAFLVEKLLSDRSLCLCPHGRPIVKELSKRELEKFFDR